MKKLLFRQADALIVFTFGKTSNKKIATPSETIVQTYSFSRGQFDEARKQATSMREFFSHDKPVCGDCPFAVNNGAKLTACYTHKLMQYSGFLSSLRSIAKGFESFDAIPELTDELADQIVGGAQGRYVRFGSYGEPSLIPLGLVSRIIDASKSHTGYTHQWRVKPEYSAYFMASTHTIEQEREARANGWRSFVASKTIVDGLVNCPASNEQGFKSNCAKCGLCSGAQGKGNKSIVILEH
jgi:hypothetical protein